MKEILITGCSSGIGYHSAHFLKDNGFRVFATARKQEDVQRLKDEGLEAFYLDLNDESSMDKCLEEILLLSDGHLYALFNNGAYGQISAIEDLATKDLRQEFETNVFSWHELSIRVLKIMRKQGYGKIIQNSSILGMVSLKYKGAYSASKYAIESLSDSLRLELRDTDIEISLIEPGPIKSNFRKNAYEKFIEKVDYENSVHKKAYDKIIKKFKLGGKDPFELEEISVSKKVLEILNTKKPKARYYVTTATYLLAFAKRLLSSSLLDKILSKI